LGAAFQDGRTVRGQQQTGAADQARADALEAKLAKKSLGTAGDNQARHRLLPLIAHWPVRPKMMPPRFLHIAILCSVVWLDACTCDNQVLSRFRSPDGEHDAALFVRNCGATTGPNVQVSVVKRDAIPRGKGNVFIADAVHGSALRAELPSVVRIHWRADAELQVTMDRRLRVFLQRSTAEGVRVLYDSLQVYD
jgi:hypothetical protein